MWKGTLAYLVKIALCLVDMSTRPIRNRKHTKPFAYTGETYDAHDRNGETKYTVSSNRSSSSVQQVLSSQDRDVTDDASENDLDNVTQLAVPRTRITESDAVIEQWYADPYQRHQPDLPGYDQWRRQNIATRLQNQGVTCRPKHLKRTDNIGMSFSRTQIITTWLMRCGGVYQPFESKRGQKPRRSRKAKLRKSTQPVMIAAAGQGINSSNKTQFLPQDMQDNTSESSDIDKGSGDDIETDAATSVFSQVKTNTTTSSPKPRPSFGRATRRGSLLASEGCIDTNIRDITRPTMSEMDDSTKIAILNDRLRVFDLVYGDAGPVSNLHVWDARLDHLSPITQIARSKPKYGFHSQGHRKMRRATLPASSPALTNHMITPMARRSLKSDSLNHGLNHNQTVIHDRDILTEDPTFGLTVVPLRQRATEDVKDLDRANSPESVAASMQERVVPDNVPISLAEVRAEEAQTYEDKRLAALEHLKQKVFPWETTDSMRGLYVADEDKTWKNQFFLVAEDKTWQRLQDRERILINGGEEAEKMIEAEAVACKLEDVRQKRREAVARGRERKIATLYGSASPI